LRKLPKFADSESNAVLPVCVACVPDAAVLAAVLALVCCALTDARLI
jgi:hypothetical protein